MNLVVLTVVKLPAGLCWRAVRKRKKRRAAGQRKTGLLGAASAADGVGERAMGPGTMAETGEAAHWPVKSPAAEVSEMEKEMRSQFYGSGFWRSPSQRE
ncbi:hypothetical protein AXF42_Ash010184 [Apostasia shenzhenica]|uniref:Uncharacterized protein n=1 Tax=Apostasia shenzhenica TaxID=1088818 RepID=A0A2I0A9T1_9ASPA|nr:hypothetical protein AXF42_Ash010184 [Apostasia shenzhenica]